MAKAKPKFRIEFLIIIAIVSVLALALIQKPQAKACTEEAKICPDGTAVGRVLPNCDFAPCPTCECPEGYLQEGDVCNPKCYYSTPRCLMPSIRCGETPSKPTENSCTLSGGTVITSLCCQSAGDFPNTCLIGACGCSPSNSHDVNYCDCGKGKCFDGKSCVSNDRTSCSSDSDCIGNTCCHPTSCINRAYRGVCNEVCTQVCDGPLDCGAGVCGCVNNRCTVIPK